MAIELTPQSYRLVLPLFEELAYHLSISAVLRGTMPGRVLVDNTDTPGTVLVCSPEGNYLASAGPIGAAELRAGQAMIEELRAGGATVELFGTPQWEQNAANLIPGVRYDLAPRRHYALSELAGDWHRHVPAPFTLRRLDAETLASPQLQGHHIQRWAQGNWGSIALFLERGFGFTLLRDGQPLSWCLADSAVDTRCEIGIHTHPDYRRQGLATIVVAAAVAQALADGYELIGWHCGEENRGSQAVAEKVGFRLTHRFHDLVWQVEGHR